MRFNIHCIWVPALLGLLSVAGCQEDCFDYYPHHEAPTTRPDVIKSGPDYYGGHNNKIPVSLPTSDTSKTDMTTTQSAQ